MTQMETKTIGNKIATARKELNISQAQLAQELFISAQAVGKWERGESMPDIIMLNRLAKILDVDLNYFSETSQSEKSETTSNTISTGKNDNFNNELKPKKPSWDMSNGNWIDADFSGLKNLHNKFSSSNLQKCKFIGSDLSGLLLKGNHVVSCDFSGSNICNSNINNSHLKKNNFNDCSLNQSKFSGSHINDCDFSRADFTGVAIKSSDFSKNTIVNAIWNQTSFIATQIANIIFDGNINDCYFEHCAFKKVTFRNALLTNTFFKNRSLKGIRFIDCKVDRLTYEFLKNGKANLTGITLISEE